MVLVVLLSVAAALAHARVRKVSMSVSMRIYTVSERRKHAGVPYKKHVLVDSIYRFETLECVGDLKEERCVTLECVGDLKEERCVTLECVGDLKERCVTPLVL